MNKKGELKIEHGGRSWKYLSVGIGGLNGRKPRGGSTESTLRTGYTRSRVFYVSPGNLSVSFVSSKDSTK